MRIDKVLLFCLIILGVFSCKNSSNKSDFDSNVKKEKMQLWHHKYNIGDEWTFRGNSGETERIEFTTKVARPVTHNEISCYIFETYGSFDESNIEVQGENYTRKNGVISMVTYISKDENNTLIESNTIEFDLVLNTNAKYDTISVKTETLTETQYDGEKPPKYPEIWDTWREVHTVSESTKTWLDEELLDIEDTTYQEIITSTFESVEKINVLNNEFNCLRISKITENSEGKKTDEETILHSPSLKNDIKYLLTSYGNQEEILSNSKLEIVDYKLFDDRVKNEKPAGKFEYAIGICLLASLFLMFQLERLIFDTEGEILRQLGALIISVFFISLFALFIVRVLGVRDIILFGTIIGLTCFIVPVYRYWIDRNDFSFLNEENLDQAEKSVDESSDLEIENDTKDNDLFSIEPNVDTQIIEQDEIDDISSDTQPKEEERFDRVALEREIINELGYGAFERWYQLTKKMLIESKNSNEDVIKGLMNYGLDKTIAEKMVRLFKK